MNDNKGRNGAADLAGTGSMNLFFRMWIARGHVCTTDQILHILFFNVLKKCQNIFITKVNKFSKN